MKKYTQEEFNNFEIIDGIKKCPTGDYSLISSFGEWCSFGENCSFGLFNYFSNPIFKDEKSCYFSKVIRSLSEVEK